VLLPLPFQHLLQMLDVGLTRQRVTSSCSTWSLTVVGLRSIWEGPEEANKLVSLCRCITIFMNMGIDTEESLGAAELGCESDH
jgi:hypothetical protein